MTNRLCKIVRKEIFKVADILHVCQIKTHKKCIQYIARNVSQYKNHWIVCTLTGTKKRECKRKRETILGDDDECWTFLPFIDVFQMWKNSTYILLFSLKCVQLFSNSLIGAQWHRQSDEHTRQNDTPFERLKIIDKMIIIIQKNNNIIWICEVVTHTHACAQTHLHIHPLKMIYLSDTFYSD